MLTYTRPAPLPIPAITRQQPLLMVSNRAPVEYYHDEAGHLRRAVPRHDLGRWLQVQLDDLAAIDDINPAPAAA